MKWRWLGLGLAFIFLFFALKLHLPKKVLIGNHTIRVEIAKSEVERQRGLSGRESLCSDCGLLFLFEKPGIYPFWMAKMRFDIDILWIKDNQVVDITYGAKKPSLEEFETPKTIYQPKVPVNQVLEVNAGWAAGSGIKVGDEVKIKD